MTPDEINRKCAELAGWTKCSQGCWKDPSGMHNPPGSHSYANMPDFTASLDACRKWLWPAIETKRLKIAYMRTLMAEVEIENPLSWADNFAIMTAPPLAHVRAFIAVMEASTLPAKVKP